MGPQVRRDVKWSHVALVVLLLLALAAGVSYVNHGLLPTIGIGVITAALFLPPRGTAVVAVVAILLSGVLAFMLPVEVPVVRLLNVTLACGLALMASVFTDRRVNRIAQLVDNEAAVLEAIPDAVMVIDGHGRVVEANAGLARLVPAARVGQPLHPLLGHQLADGRSCPGDCCLAGNVPEDPTPVPVEGERIMLAGRSVPVAYTCGPLTGRGLVVNLRDVTERVHAAEERRVLLDEAARQAEQWRMREVMGSPRAALATLPGLRTDIWSTADGAAPITDSDLVTASTLPDGRVLLLMVDAAGKGVASLRDAWKVMYACRAHIQAGAPLADMIRQCAETLTGDGDAPSASILGVIVDPVTGHLLAATGGHPPPLLVRPCGQAGWVETTGRALGETDAGSNSVGSTLLEPGDSLVLYTDGVVDGDKDVIQGLATLRSAAIALRGQPIDGLARRLLEAVASPSHVDGEATLVVVRLGDAG